MKHRDIVKNPELNEPLLSTFDRDISGAPRKINAEVYIWIRKFFWSDYLLPWRWCDGFLKTLKQGHAAIELPRIVTEKIKIPYWNKEGQLLTPATRPFYLSYYPKRYRAKSKDTNDYPHNEYELKLYCVPIDLEKAAAYLRSQLNVILTSEQSKKNYLEDLPLNQEEHCYFPNETPSFFLFGNMFAAFFGKTYNCTSFVVDFLQSCGADIPIYPRHLGVVLFYNVLVGAMAGFNVVSSSDLLFDNKKTLVKADTSEVIGTVSLILLVAQGSLSFISIFIVPNIKNTKAINKVSRQVDKTMIGNNSEANASTIYVAIHAILFGLNLFYEQDYGDNALGLVAGTGSALTLSMLFYLVAINLFGAIFDDTNYIIRPSGLRTKIRNYLWAINNEEDKTYTIDGYEKHHAEKGLQAAV